MGRGYGRRIAGVRNMKRTVIYHKGCMDGVCAAWVAWRKWGNEDTEYVAAAYGDTTLPNVSGREVWVLDFHHSREVTERMAAAAGSFRVLDHHKSAAEDLAGLPYAHFESGKSGAGMAWDEFFADKPRPWLVDYVEDRDLWKWSLPHSRVVNAWLATLPLDGAGLFDIWEDTARQGFAASFERGEGVAAYIAQYVRVTAACARMVQFEGHTVPMVNAPPLAISELVGHLAEGHPFAVGWHQRSNGQFAFSLRSRDSGEDVSRIARRYGGGGHARAAGFELDRMIG